MDQGVIWNFKFYFSKNTFYKALSAIVTSLMDLGKGN